MTKLTGRRVVVTRALAEGAELARRLTDLGAVPILFPTIVRRPIADLTAVTSAIASLGAEDWVAVTSPASADILASALVVTTPTPRIAAVGAATAEVLRRRGVSVAHVAPGPGGEALAGSLPDLSGRRVLLPRSSEGRPETVAGLRRAGAEVRVLEIYRTEVPAAAPEGVAALRAGMDAILFTSPSTITGFLALTGPDGPKWLAHAEVVCLGATTAAAARAAGVERPVTADATDIDGLLTALESCFTDAVPGHR